MVRGQFFSIDVFIASIILVSGAVVLLFSIVGQTSLQQAQLFSSDVLRETLTTRVRDLNYDVLTKPLAQGGYFDASDPYGIRDPDMTLGELIGEYEYLANQASSPTVKETLLEHRDNITIKTIAPLISDQYSYMISIGPTGDLSEIVNRTRVPMNDSEYLVASRSILAGIDRNREFFGPYVLEVLVWN